jgi:hypothetical protein
MRVLSLVLLLALSWSAVAQTMEIIPPASIGEDSTATWTVVFANPGAEPVPAFTTTVSFYSTPAFGTHISIPPGCATINPPHHTDCNVAALAPGERRELQFTLSYNTRHTFLIATVNILARFIRRDVVFPREFPVTNTGDSGPGSLRQAILDINETCAALAEPCGPAFRIDGPVPVEGWFTIRPSSPLPALTANIVVVDGRTQTAHTGDTNPAGPEIMLDGAATAEGHGLHFTGREGHFTDLAIGHFPGNGITSRPQFTTKIHRCHLGMDPSGVRRAPNGTRGAQIERGWIEVTDSLLGGNLRSGGWFESEAEVTIVRNRFVDNGASGFYAKTRRRFYNFVIVEDNVISGNAHAGISLDRLAMGTYAKNSFAGNLGRAIDIGIDGPTAAMVPGLPGQGGIIGMPTVLSARYENGETVIEVQIAPRSPNNIFRPEIVHFYASPVAKDGGEHIGIADGYNSTVPGRFTLRVPRDLRGQWVSAATTAGYYIVDFEAPEPGTSEISEPRLVE